MSPSRSARSRQRDLLRAEQPHDRVEQDGAGDDEVRAAGIEARQAEPPLHVEGDDLLARAVKGLGGDAGVVDGVAVEQPAAGQRHFPQAETRARGGDHPAEAGGRQLLGEFADLATGCA